MVKIIGKKMDWENQVAGTETPEINQYPADPEVWVIAKNSHLLEDDFEGRRVRPRLDHEDFENYLENQTEDYSNDLKRSKTNDLLASITDNLMSVERMIADDNTLLVSPLQSSIISNTDIAVEKRRDAFAMSPKILREKVSNVASNVTKLSAEKIKPTFNSPLQFSNKRLEVELKDYKINYDQRFYNIYPEYLNQPCSSQIANSIDKKALAYKNVDDEVICVHPADDEFGNKPCSSKMADYKDQCELMKDKKIMVYDESDEEFLEHSKFQSILPKNAINSTSPKLDEFQNEFLYYSDSDEEFLEDSKFWMKSNKVEDAARKLNKKVRDSLSHELGKLQKELAAKERERNRKWLPRFKVKDLDNEIVKKKKEIESLRTQLEQLRSINNNSSDSEEEYKGENFGFGADFENLLHEVFDRSAATVQGLHDLKDTLSRCPEENEVAPDPIGLRVPLMLHQKRALKWMLFRENENKYPGGLLADDMGLGKTLTMISLILQTMPPPKILPKIEVTNDLIDSEDDWGTETPEKVIKNDKNPSNITFNGGTLVVCPLSLLQQWQNEVATRVEQGLITVKIHHGKERLRDPKDIIKFDIVITTYHTLAREYARQIALFKINWKRVVLDEAHIVRNPEKSWSQSVCSLKADKRWALTGTPVHNKPLDLYALLKFLRCSPWNDIKVWKCTMKADKDGVKPLTTVLKSLVMRRTKIELQKSGEMPPMPLKIIRDIDIELEESQAKVYRTMLAYSRTLFGKYLLQRKHKAGIHDYDADKRVLNAVKNKDLSEFKDDDIPKDLLDEFNKVLLNGEKIQQYHILVLLLRLRQICNHPGLLNKMIKEEEIAQIVGADDDKPTNKKKKGFNALLVSNNKDNPMRSDNPVFQEGYKSAKINKIFEILNEVLPKGDKIVIVSQWTSMLKIIEYHLTRIYQAEWEMFSGEVEHKDRQDIVNRFNDPDSDLKILLLSLTAGGVGLNLFGGNHLLLVDNHWNPQLENQAQDRIYRYGQTKEVTIYRFLSTETIEERVKELQCEKLKLAKEIFTGLKMSSTRLTINDLKRLFQMR